jgi:exosortase
MEVTLKSPLPKYLQIKFIIPLVLLAVFVGLFFSTFTGLYLRWIKWDEGLSHGLLVNLVFVYLLFKSLPWEQTGNSKWTDLLLHLGLALASVCWFIFHLANIYILEQLMLLCLLAGLYACSYGLKNTLKHRLLLLLPIFTIPVWEELNDLLVNLSGFVVGKLVQLAHFPAVIEGNSIFIPYGHIVIADGCSGLRYFEIALALAYIVGLLNNYDEKRLAPTLLLAALLGLVANWIRIFILVVIGYESKMQSSLMSNHEYFGWALFGLMCLPALYFAPVVTTPTRSDTQASSRTPKLIAPLCVLAIGPVLSLFFTGTPQPSTIHRLLPATSQRIAATKMPLFVTAPENNLEENALLAVPSGQVYVQVNQYQRVLREDKLVPHINRLYDSDEWTSLTQKIRVKDHSALMTRFRHKTSGQEVVQLQWFEVGSEKTDSLRMAKLLQIPALVRGQNNFKIVTIQSPCISTTCEKISAAITDSAATLLTEH